MAEFFSKEFMCRRRLSKHRRMAGMQTTGFSLCLWRASAAAVKWSRCWRQALLRRKTKWIETSENSRHGSEMKTLFHALQVQRTPELSHLRKSHGRILTRNRCAKTCLFCNAA
jgi:hypothetical protein